MLVVDGDAVRDVLERDQEFTVEPYGVEMVKVMSPQHNGGFSTFVLSTDDNAVYEPDKRLLTAVCNRAGRRQRSPDVIHRGLRAPRRRGACRGAGQRLADDRRRRSRRPLRAGDARPPLSRRARRRAARIVRADAGDADVLRRRRSTASRRRR